MPRQIRPLEAAASDATTRLPTAVRAEALAAVLGDGIIRPGTLGRWRAKLGWTTEEAMRALLPLASVLARAPISDFRVGAVACCVGTRGDATRDDEALYLGANFEFVGASLSSSVHAEQAAVNRAWLDGATGLRCIATDAFPCGHCRQFLCEARSGPDGVAVFTPEGRHSLESLLPHPFGPGALDVTSRLLDPREREVVLPADFRGNELAELARGAASRSYAPYSECAAGIALRLDNGETVLGRSCETAAFNPSLSPLQSALATLGARLVEPNAIVAAVLVETAGLVSHRERDQWLLTSVAPGIVLTGVLLPA